jgi:Nucleotidyl transferase AbiEii toxin, Type IV TA system
MQFTRPATWDDVKTIARFLHEADAQYALVGGYAIAAHGFSRFTEDIDVLVNPSAENARRSHHDGRYRRPACSSA